LLHRITKILFVFVSAVKAVWQPPAAAAKPAQQTRAVLTPAQQGKPEFLNKKQRREESRRKGKVSQICACYV
jgi:hypothetical protein